MPDPTPQQMMLHMALTQQVQTKGDKSFVLYSIAGALLIGWPLEVPEDVREWAMAVCGEYESREEESGS